MQGCRWETFYIFAFCGLVVEIPTYQLKLIYIYIYIYIFAPLPTSTKVCVHTCICMCVCVYACSFFWFCGREALRVGLFWSEAWHQDFGQETHEDTDIHGDLARPGVFGFN